MAVHSISVTDSSGSIFIGRCYFHGFYVGGMDGTNDATVTIYDNTSAAGNPLVPAHATDAASPQRLGGAMQHVGEQCELGIYVAITCSGTVTVTCKVEA